MRRTLFILLVVCALSTLTAVPKPRRAINPDEEENSKSGSGVKICAPQTPCGWSVYNLQTKRIMTNITNSYCTCAEGTECLVTEDDGTAGTYVLTCHSRPGS